MLVNKYFVQKRKEDTNGCSYWTLKDRSFVNDIDRATKFESAERAFAELSNIMNITTYSDGELIVIKLTYDMVEVTQHFQERNITTDRVTGVTETI